MHLSMVQTWSTDALSQAVRSSTGTIGQVYTIDIREQEGNYFVDLWCWIILGATLSESTIQMVPASA